MVSDGFRGRNPHLAVWNTFGGIVLVFIGRRGKGCAELRNFRTAADDDILIRHGCARILDDFIYVLIQHKPSTTINFCPTWA